MKATCDLSVVIPAYNEAERLPGTLRDLRNYSEKHARLLEIIVVDDGSTDGTPSLVADLAADFPALRLVSLGANRGKGAAVRAGMASASGELRLFMDADNSTPIACVTTLEDAVQDGADIVMGSRAAPGARILRSQAVPRQRMGQAFNVFMRRMTGLPWRDTQCGFKLFRSEAIARILPLAKVKGFAFDVEWLLIAISAGLRVEERPVAWTNDEHSTVSMIRHPVVMLAEVMAIAVRARIGLYKPPPGARIKRD